jgi:Asp-tRNA(Asn)/Glu-tRNA(Gln) amidotransferase A subunit family amidase
MERLGVSVEEFSMPYFKQLMPCWQVIAAVESLAALEEYANTRMSDFGEDVQYLLTLGQHLSAVDYVKAQRVRRLITDAISNLLTKVDIIALPTTAITAPKIGPPKGLDVTVRKVRKTFLEAILLLTAPFNVSGHPSLSLPDGFTRTGLPTGLQLVGRDFDESRIYKVADAYERNTPWHKRRPSE